MPRKMTAIRAIDRFIEYNKRPFKVADVANDTGFHPNTVRNLMPQFVEEGRVKILLKEKDGNIYVRCTASRDIASCIQYDWRPKLHILRQIYQLVEQYRHSEMVVKHSTMSRETTYRYLKILRAERCVVKDPVTHTLNTVQFKPVVRWFSEYKPKGNAYNLR